MLGFQRGWCHGTARHFCACLVSTCSQRAMRMLGFHVLYTVVISDSPLLDGIDIKILQISVTSFYCSCLFADILYLFAIPAPFVQRNLVA